MNGWIGLEPKSRTFKNPYSKFKAGLDETYREILSMEELQKIETKQI